MNDLLSNLPLREPTFLILLSLAPGPRHGYAILKDVESLSEGRVKMSTGTLYGAIERLLDQGWIRLIDDPVTNETNRKRKSYELTDLGRKMLEAEIARLGALVSIAKTRLAEDNL